jgi:peptide/nickel transport system permease protein
MLAYIIRRILLMFPTLIGITLMLFLMARFAPGLTGGMAYGEGGARASREDRQKAILNYYRKLHMVDDNDKFIPLPIQYVRWLRDAFQLKFGDSIKYGESVNSLIIKRIPVTLTMNLISTTIVYLLALPGGILAAIKRGKFFDLSWGLTTLALYSFPVVLLGALLIFLLANPQQLAWFPSGQLHDVEAERFTTLQYAADYIWHLALPIFAMTLGGFAYLTKMMRASILDNLSQDFIRTARAKGVSAPRIYLWHVFRNSLLPLITIFSATLPALLGGSLIIESIFSIPGMGQLALIATQSRDLPVLQAVTFVGAIISLVCLLLQDICYAMADPRVSYD